MNTQHVTLNGRVIAVGRDHFKLVTMVRSFEHHDGVGDRIATHELAVEGFDASGREATTFVSPVSLKKGDVIQIVIGDADQPEQIASANAG